MLQGDRGGLPLSSQRAQQLCLCVLSHFSHVQLFATPWTVARQAPLCMGFPKEEYWSGLLCPLPEDLPEAPTTVQWQSWDSNPGGCVYVLSCTCFSANPWTVDHQAPLFMGFSSQEYWSGLPCPPPGDLLTQGSKPSLLNCRQILYFLSHKAQKFFKFYQLWIKLTQTSMCRFAYFYVDWNFQNLCIFKWKIVERLFNKYIAILSLFQ